MNTEKEICVDCGKRTNQYIFILTGKGWKYEPYCIMCARVFFSKLSKEKMSNINKTTLNSISREYDRMIQQNYQAIINSGFSMDEVPVEYKRYLLKSSKEKLK